MIAPLFWWVFLNPIWLFVLVFFVFVIYLN
jgi:hypothetical protein